MAITIETRIYKEGEGFYYTDAINWEEGQGTLTCEKIMWTEDAALIDTWIYQTTARHKRVKLILIRDRI